MNVQINTPEKAQELAREIANSAQEAQEKRTLKMEEFLNQLEQVNPALGGAEHIASLLTLSEESFALLAPVFLDELEKSFNNVNDQLAMAQAMNAAGVRPEDVQEEYKTICDTIDSNFVEILSAQKRDFIKRMLGITYNAVSSVEGASKRNITIPIELSSDNAKIPAYAHLTDAGADIYITEDAIIHPGETKLITTDLKMAIPRGYAGLIYPRSGRSLNSKLRIGNSVGVIDSSYRGEIGIIADNIDSPIRHLEIDENGRVSNIEYGADIVLSAGEKIAQFVLTEVPHAVFYPVETVATYEGDGRGIGGFGSTGNK